MAVVVRNSITGPSTRYCLVSTGGLVLAGAGDGQHAFRLQELEGVAGVLCPFLFGDGEDFVFKIGLTHVEEALPGHGAVLHSLFFRDHVQDRIH
jgi:hypothetical protein